MGVRVGVPRPGTVNVMTVRDGQHIINTDTDEYLDDTTGAVGDVQTKVILQILESNNSSVTWVAQL